MNKIYSRFNVVLFLLLIQGCSGNGFHLRKNVELSPQYTEIYLQGLVAENEFITSFREKLSEASGDIVTTVSQAKSIINFSKFEEGRRVIAYTSDRRAREYLVFLKVEYSIRNINQKLSSKTKHRINIDRSYLYDPDFALGKAEEEKRVKQALYEEATRLILLRIRYAK